MICARQGRVMGSDLEVLVAIADPTQRDSAETAIALAFTWLAEAESRLSRFIPQSELCALNRAAGSWFLASADLFAIVSESLVWAARTEGLFDPTLLTTIEALGYDRSFDRIAHAEVASRPVPMPKAQAFAQVALDHDRRAIRLPVGVGIDLGGIGKGWAADRVLSTVFAAFPDVLVNVGGDLALRGGPGKGWVVGVRDPRMEGTEIRAYVGGVTLRAGGIATSGAAWRWWRTGGVPTHHLIDPRTGQPTTLVSITPTPDAVMTVTVLATSATDAEVLAKYALLLGRDAGLPMLDGAEDHAGLFILGDGRVIPSANLIDYLARHGQAPEG